jgi:hypothetical protein
MPPVEPIEFNVSKVDLSARFPVTTTIVGSPALAAETIIASLTIPNFGGVAIVSGVLLQGWAAFTVGTSGTAVTFRIRQTNVAGTVVVSTGALTGSQHGAGILSADDITGFDASPGVGVYVLTMQVTAGAAVSTVSAVSLAGTVI